MRLKMRIACVLCLLGLMLQSAQAASDPVREAIKTAVTRYNEAQFKWLHDPTNPDLQKAFLDTVQESSPAEQETIKLVDRYLAANAHLLDVSTHSVKILEITVYAPRQFLTPEDMGRIVPPPQPRATVITEENSNWSLSSGRKFVQKKNKHTYFLRHTDEGWKVVQVKFEFQWYPF